MKSKGLLNFPRLTSLGPLVKTVSGDVPPPQFKTKTFEFDTVDIAFKTTGGSLSMNTIDNPGGRGVERGSSFSLDGAYNDHRSLTPDGYKDYVTLVYELDQDADIPFFYINPILSKDPMTVNGDSIVLEGHTRFTEAEVAVQDPIDPQDAIGAFISISKEEVKRKAEERKEGMRRTDIFEERVDATLSHIDTLKSDFVQLDTVPDTEFRKAVRDIGDEINDLNGRNDWSKVEQMTREVHKAIAESYNISYESVKQKAKERL